MANPVIWGILGTGWVVRESFLPALKELGSDRADAIIASRSHERAEGLYRQWGLRGFDKDYESLLARPEVEVVYVALPNHLHEHWTRRALQAGKHVLCEKPLGLDPDSVQRMLSAADAAGRFLWEAYAFLFRAQTQRLLDYINSGAMGGLDTIQSSFFTDIGTQNFRWHAEMGGGALYDLGVYPLRLASLFWDHPQRGSLWLDMSGAVDALAWGQVQYDVGQILQFSVGLRRPYQTAAELVGREARLVVSNPYHPGAYDRVWLVGPHRREEWAWADSTPSFTDMLRHIGRAVCADDEPRHLARSGSHQVADAIGLLWGSAQPI